MKKHEAVIYVLSLTIISCKKDPPVIEPWNLQYIGSYYGEWTSKFYNMGIFGPLKTKDTTIVISSNSKDSALTTSLSNCQVIYYNLRENTFPIYHGAIYFRNDSMFYNCMNGGLGQGFNETFKGKKQ